MRLAALLFILFSLQFTSAISAATSELNADFEEFITLDTDTRKQLEFPIFGKNKTSNKKQLKFASKRSRRHGKGIMKARKRKGANNGRSLKGGGKAKRGSKKKEGCNT